MKKLFGFSVSIFTALTLAACGTEQVITPTPDPDVDNKTIAIMHTNDVHGRAEYDDYNGALGLAKLSTAISNEATKYDDYLLFDAGDVFHGTSFATLSKGQSMLDVYNEMGYSAFVPGNHDFNYGLDRLLELEDEANFPFLAANIEYNNTSGKTGDVFDDYLIIEKNGLKFGVFGLATPETAFKTNPANVADITFTDPVIAAQNSVTALESEGADVIIALSHLGTDTSSDNTSIDVANGVDGIDLIIDGHSHTELPSGMEIDDTLIVSAGQYTENLGVVELQITDGDVVSATAKLMDFDSLSTVNENSTIATKIDEVAAANAVILDEVVGNTTIDLDGERANCRTNSCDLGSLAADAMRDETGADIAITNGGGVRSSIAAGDITKGDVVTVFPFGNYVVTKEVTTSELYEIISASVSGYGYGTGGALQQLGSFAQVSGITFELDFTVSQIDPQLRIYMGGVLLDSNDTETTYVVATNDFLAVGGDSYPVFKDKPTLNEYKGLDEILIDYINNTLGGTITSAPESRFDTIGLEVPTV